MHHNSVVVAGGVSQEKKETRGQSSPAIRKMSENLVHKLCSKNFGSKMQNLHLKNFYFKEIGEKL